MAMHWDLRNARWLSTMFFTLLVPLFAHAVCGNGACEIADGDCQNCEEECLAEMMSGECDAGTEPGDGTGEPGDGGDGIGEPGDGTGEPGDGGGDEEESFLCNGQDAGGGGALPPGGGPQPGGPCFEACAPDSPEKSVSNAST